MVRCSGICVSGLRCKKTTNSESGFCNVHEKITCSVCLTDNKKFSKTTYKLVDCGHTFCVKCISTWCFEKGEESTCPTCRQKVNKTDLAFMYKWGIDQGILCKKTCMHYPVHRLPVFVLVTICLVYNQRRRYLFNKEEFTKTFKNVTHETDEYFLRQLNKICYKKEQYFKCSSIKHYLNEECIHVLDTTKVVIETVLEQNF